MHNLTTFHYCFNFWTYVVSSSDSDPDELPLPEELPLPDELPLPEELPLPDPLPEPLLEPVQKSKIDERIEQM